MYGKETLYFDMFIQNPLNSISNMANFCLLIFKIGIDEMVEGLLIEQDYI